MFAGMGSLARVGIFWRLLTGVRRHARVWLQWVALAVVFALIEHVYADLQSYLTLTANANALLSALLVKVGLELTIVLYALWLLYATFLRQEKQEVIVSTEAPKHSASPNNDAVMHLPSKLVYSPKKRADLVREKLRQQVAQRQQ
jgi:signal transduction histidine kinase